MTPPSSPEHSAALTIWLVGIGTGSPELLTQEAREALRQARLILIPRKGLVKEALADIRYAILAGTGSTAPVVEFDMPVRDERLEYDQKVSAWHDEIAQRWSNAIAQNTTAAKRGPVVLLVWGDPSLYDSTLRIAARLRPPPNVRVVPGITALQALCAAHALPLNTIDGTVTITTGRKLRMNGWPEGTETMIVMLDGDCSFRYLTSKYPDLHIWWGAFLGMPEQILDKGPLSEVTERIISTRAAARVAHGWVMDTYLLRYPEK